MIKDVKATKKKLGCAKAAAKSVQTADLYSGEKEMNKNSAQIDLECCKDLLFSLNEQLPLFTIYCHV